jgi:glutaredoxin
MNRDFLYLLSMKHLQIPQMPQKSSFPLLIIVLVGLLVSCGSEKDPALKAKEARVQLNTPVIIYTTTWCPYCRSAKDFFAENSIPYTEHNIEESTEARHKYEKLGGGAVPLIVIGERKYNGFYPGRLRKVLGLVEEVPVRKVINRESGY